MAWLYQTPKFQENRTGRNPINWLQIWPDVPHLKIQAAMREEVPNSFL